MLNSERISFRRRIMRKRKAFTLVELLVVIGIIALLISLLLPALNKARDSAMRIACAANVRSLALFTLMYATDNHNTLMSNGANNTMIYGSQGNAPVTTNSSLGTFFAYYMKVSNANTPSQYSTLAAVLRYLLQPQIPHSSHAYLPSGKPVRQLL